MKATIVLVALALTACATVPQANAGPTAGLGQTAAVNGLMIRPIAVIEDSRCPAEVKCVWAGRLTVRARMNGPGWTQIRDFELGVPQAVDQYRVTLIAAEPQKQAGAEIDRRAYRFTFDTQGS
ncbi:hypothetical protein LZ496_03215 [Sphingomonas sp. NSE70-1]|uniref:Lipoprotein n=1 Tax=Sphingomonas caseinilyticus TaxID=2908205 RepID=A0ABT0RS19_9SPHN|nr:hypothetical protein [Sphingomonas caseinilyticus]MCL6697795.1 hypothetical protein [Sphingomonas caseinilyticus]